MKENTESVKKWLETNCANIDLFLQNSRLSAIKHLICYNILFWSLFTYWNYVIQKDYSRYDMSGIEASINLLYHQDICILAQDNSALELA